MSRIEPVPVETLSKEQRDWLKYSELKMGFQTNAGLTFARVPGLLENLDKLTWEIFGKDGLIRNELKRLVAIITSTASGCTYCKAHTTHGASFDGIEAQKLRSVWEFETSKLFSAAERAALRVAQCTGQTPIIIEDEDFDELRKYYSDNQICEIVAVISLFRFLNCWHSILATQLESDPLASFNQFGPGHS